MTKKRAGHFLIALCLFAPSLWMLATIPPLWRDVDAYNQITSPPGMGTILHYGPGYSFLARVPLYLGHAFDSLRAGNWLPKLSFFAEPILSDSGVFLLLLLQHTALLYASCSLIFSASKLFVARMGLAILWALNPMFYAFAHCVGSETLSLILLLLIAHVGLRIVRTPKSISWGDWSLFALLFFVSLLTRHINAVLASLLPLAFLLTAAGRFTGALREKTLPIRRSVFQRARKDLRGALQAIGLGVACILLSQLALSLMCKAAGISSYSRLGFTFAWRAKSFSALSAEERARIIEQAAARTNSPNVRNVLNVLRAETAAPDNTGALRLLEKERAVLPPEIANSDEEFCNVLNSTTRALLLPPSPPFLRLVLSDLKRSQKSNIPQVVRHLVRATGIFFAWPGSMPLCAHLVTFRESSSAEITGLLQKHPYLRLWKTFTYRQLLWASVAALLLFLLVSRARALAVPAYATALISTGLLIMLANCLFTELIPRFTLPMWTMTITATTLLLGAMADSVSLRARKARRARVRQVKEPGGPTLPAG